MKSPTSNYRKLRSKLIERGWTLRKFAIERGYPPATVYCAAAKTRAGVSSVKILRELEAIAYAN